jgi:hypothetical protein
MKLPKMKYNLVDVTGTIPEVPACPEHGEALIPEFRTVRQGKQAGYWRCPIANKVYIIPPAI